MSDDYVLVAIVQTFPEVEIILSVSAKVVISLLNFIFAQQCLPTVVKTGNGQSFRGQGFRNFVSQLTFRHRKAPLSGRMLHVVNE